MANTPKRKAPSKAKAAASKKDDAVTLEEPGGESDSYARGEGPWMRGLYMLVFAALLYVAHWVLFVATVIQFFWLLIAGERNAHIAEFGASLAKWMAKTARFQTADSEDKPFPWSKWGA